MSSRIRKLNSLAILSTLQEVFEIGKGICRGPCRGLRAKRVDPGLTCRFGVELSGVLVIVAVKAQQFPVAAVAGVVVMIVVAVVNRQFAQIQVRELTRTATTDPRVDLSLIHI